MNNEIMGRLGRARLAGLHLQVLGIQQEVSKLQESGPLVAELLPENCRKLSFSHTGLDWTELQQEGNYLGQEKVQLRLSLSAICQSDRPSSCRLALDVPNLRTIMSH